MLGSVLVHERRQCNTRCSHRWQCRFMLSIMKDHANNIVRALLVMALLSVLPGCSTFERDWKAMADQEAPGAGIEGRWNGTWLSDSNGHGGGLRCIISREEDDTLLARYHATYGKALTFEYDMPMAVVVDGEVYHFSAEADLGWLAGGVYEYDGTVEGDQFRSNYECKSDHGTFEMERVK